MTPYKPEPQVSQPNPANPDVEVEDMLIMNFADLYDARSKSTDRTWADKLIAEQKSALLAWRDQAVAQARRVDENTSDGYHTFRELYDFRRLFNAALFNEWAAQGKYEVHKSFKHHDGELAFGGGWFVVMATLPTGQISNHYEANAWSQFHIEVRERADEWDGHTPQDVLQRLAALSATDDGGKRNDR